MIENNLEVLKLIEKTRLYDFVIINTTNPCLKLQSKKGINEILRKDGLEFTTISKISIDQIIDEKGEEIFNSIKKNEFEKFGITKHKNTDDDGNPYHLIILEGFDLLYLKEGFENFLESIIKKAVSSNNETYWIILNSENLHIFSKFSDVYPKIFSTLTRIKEKNILFEKKDVDKKVYKKLEIRNYKKWLRDKVAVNKIVKWDFENGENSKQHQEKILFLINKQLLYLSHISASESNFKQAFFNLPDTSATKRIYTLSNCVWFRFWRSKAAKLTAIFTFFFFLLFFGAISFVLASSNQSIIEKGISEREKLNNINRYRIKTQPGEVYNSIINYSSVEPSKNRSEKAWKWFKDKFRRNDEEDKLKLKNDYLLSIYNSYPHTPSKTRINFNNLINDEIIDFRSTNKYLYVLKSDSLFFMPHESTSNNFQAVSFSKIMNFKTNDVGDEVLLLTKDSILYKFYSDCNFFEEIKEGEISNSIIDYDISKSGKNIAYITSNKKIVYKGEISHESQSVELVNQEMQNSKIEILWEDYIGVRNSTEFNLFKVKCSKDKQGNDTEVFSKFDSQGRHLRNFWSYKGAGFNHNFPLNGRFSLQEEYDSEQVGFVTYNPILKKANGGYIFKISENLDSELSNFADTSNKESKFYRKPNGLLIPKVESLCQKIDFTNQKLFIGLNNESILIYDYLMNKPDFIHHISNEFSDIRIVDTLTIKGHRAAITQIELFEKEQIFASLSRDNELILWDYEGFKINSYHFPPSTEIKMESYKKDKPVLIVLNEGKVYQIDISKTQKSSMNPIENGLIFEKKKPYNDNDSESEGNILRLVDSILFMKSKNHNCFSSPLLLNDGNNGYSMVFSVSHTAKRNGVYKLDFNSSYKFSSFDSTLIFRVNTTNILDRAGVLEDKVSTIGVELDKIYKNSVELIDSYFNSSENENLFYLKQDSLIVLDKDNLKDTENYCKINLQTFFSKEELTDIKTSLFDIVDFPSEDCTFLVGVAQKGKVVIKKVSSTETNSTTIFDKDFEQEVKHIDLVYDKNVSKFRIKVSFVQTKSEKWTNCTFPLEHDLANLLKIIDEKRKPKK